MPDRVVVQRTIDSIRSLLCELETQVQDLVRVRDSAVPVAQRQPIDTSGMPVDGRAGAEYLSIRDLAEQIPYAEQTIRNLMTRGIFLLGEHYIKPRSRVMFRWSKVREWLERQTAGQ
ncbi:MAG: hypothetical protein HY615_16790 [Candidatus Rokubacteria bacterium]|nr:hypothetical protein [Candidatus Rokubacteria bacterium]